MKLGQEQEHGAGDQQLRYHKSPHDCCLLEPVSAAGPCLLESDRYHEEGGDLGVSGSLLFTGIFFPAAVSAGRNA